MYSASCRTKKQTGYTGLLLLLEIPEIFVVLEIFKKKSFTLLPFIFPVYREISLHVKTLDYLVENIPTLI